MGVMEKIKEIEAEMARTQKNKATNYHLGTLKAKLARLRNELFVEQSGGSSGGATGEGFDVARNGDARVALIGFPSAGQSTLVGALTATVRTSTVLLYCLMRLLQTRLVRVFALLSSLIIKLVILFIYQYLTRSLAPTGIRNGSLRVYHSHLYPRSVAVQGFQDSSLGFARYY